MATIQQRASIDFRNVSRIVNLLPAIADGQPVTYEQLNAQLEGMAWKDNVRVKTTANLSLATPGATIDGVTLSPGDRFLVASQTSIPTNGIYTFNGAATLATRTTDASTLAELKSAIVTVDEGTSAGTSWRQTTVAGVIDTADVVFVSFGASVPFASETVAGKAELATQAEVDAGVDDERIVTPLKLATWSGRKLKYSTQFGDGSNTSYTITHNLGTKLVDARVYETGGTFREVVCEIRRPTTNTLTLIFDDVVTSNELTVVVLG